jgi:hypothetical protein
MTISNTCADILPQKNFRHLIKLAYP